MSDNTQNKQDIKDNKRKKAVLWSLLWANVSMLGVLGATVLFLYFDYRQKMKNYATSFAFEINPIVIIVAYIIGMLVLWGIIYRYETKELVVKEDPHQNHNIYY